MKSNASKPDAATFCKGLVAHSTRLERYIASKLPNRFRSAMSPCDVLQEVYSAAFRSASTFSSNEPGDLDRWLTTIVNNTLTNMIAKATCLKRGGSDRVAFRVEDIDTSLTNLYVALVSPLESPSRSCSAKESAQAIRIALGSLSDDYRRVAWAYEIQGEPIAEIAAREGRTKNAIRGILVRARKQMRARLGVAAMYFSDSGSQDEES